MDEILDLEVVSGLIGVDIFSGFIFLFCLFINFIFLFIFIGGGGIWVVGLEGIDFFSEG